MSWSKCVAILRSVRAANWMRCRSRKSRSTCSPSRSSPARPARIGTRRQLFELMRSAYPYRELTREEFDDVVRMLAEGFSTKRGRRGALIHHDAVNQRVRGRRGARLVALTSGGAIPDNADYRVVLEPSETVHRHGQRRLRRREHGRRHFPARQRLLANPARSTPAPCASKMRTDSRRASPSGWARRPGRTGELSRAVSDLRSRWRTRSQALRAQREVSRRCAVAAGGRTRSARDRARGSWRTTFRGDSPRARRHPFAANSSCWSGSSTSRAACNWSCIPRSAIRVNRAWGLALRKRFCRSFNFRIAGGGDRRRHRALARAPSIRFRWRTFSTI